MIDRVGERFERLVDIMRALRARTLSVGPGADHASLRPSCSRRPTSARGDRERQPAHLCEELGDFLFEAVSCAHQRGAGDFAIGDAIDAICNKLVRRHPHVFERRAVTRR